MVNALLYKDDIEELDALGEVLQPVEFKSGDCIMRGAAGDDMFLLKREAFASRSNKASLKDGFDPSTFSTAMGEMALIPSSLGQPPSLHIAMSARCAWTEGFRYLVDQNLAFARILTRLVGDRLKKSVEYVSWKI